LIVEVQLQALTIKCDSEDMGDLPPAANPRAAKASHMNPRLYNGATNIGRGGTNRDRWNPSIAKQKARRKGALAAKQRNPISTVKPKHTRRCGDVWSHRLAC